MWKHLAANTLTFLIVALFLAAGAISWGVDRYRAAGPLETGICLRVPSFSEGGNFNRVRNDLLAAGAISSQWIFDAGVDYSGRGGDLKQGSFLIPAGASMAEIIETVTEGGGSTCGTQVVYNLGIAGISVRVREMDPATSRLTEVARYTPGAEAAPAEYQAALGEADTQFSLQVIEGTTVWQVVTGMYQIEQLDGEVPVLPPEGMLAPGEYAFRPGDDVADLVAQMQARQEGVLAQQWAARADDLPVTTMQEALILASIIEKETGRAEERPQVASVFVNRLETPGWRLETDPTIIYGITRGLSNFDRGIGRLDREGRTEQTLHGEVIYNTYQIDGLPPTPIANPGEAAIMAALNPADTPYFFFVADGQGGHAFAVTYDEHLENIDRWLATQDG